MSILGQDTFTRTNQSGWGTASDGNTYTNTGGGTLAISNNHGTLTNAGNDTNMQHGSYTSGNIDVLVRITPTNVNDIFGPEGRYSAPGGSANCYKLVCYGGAIHVNKCVNNTTSQLTTVAFAISANQAYWMRLRIVGNTITGTIWLDGNNESTATSSTTTDNSINGVGGAALLGNTATTNTISYDSLTVTDATRTRTISTTSALLLTRTRTIPIISALLSTNTCTITNTTALLSTNTHSVPVTASLQSTLTRTIPNTGSLQATLQRPIQSSACLSIVTPTVLKIATGRDGKVTGHGY